ncbi:hypothetical protein ACRALDRAFT_209537 [Sodiomyces alcalophilus JCM 7366]|uniref:uncharacterized protein n=1 Tax=Sodiomyces alcalophilus JCM 7366 TaxID=591952 RepID=UPI0039B50CCD
MSTTYTLLPPCTGRIFDPSSTLATKMPRFSQVAWSFHPRPIASEKFLLGFHYDYVARMSLAVRFFPFLNHVRDKQRSTSDAQHVYDTYHTLLWLEEVWLMWLHRLVLHWLTLRFLMPLLDSLRLLNRREDQRRLQAPFTLLRCHVVVSPMVHGPAVGGNGWFYSSTVQNVPVSACDPSLLSTLPYLSAMFSCVSTDMHLARDWKNPLGSGVSLMGWFGGSFLLMVPALAVMDRDGWVSRQWVAEAGLGDKYQAGSVCRGADSPLMLTLYSDRIYTLGTEHEKDNISLLSVVVLHLCGPECDVRQIPTRQLPIP